MKSPPPRVRRLPCAALSLAAAAGIAFARAVPVSGGVLAAAAAAALLSSILSRRFAAAFWIGVASAFAAAQAWQYRDSPAARLAAALTTDWQVCEATIQVAETPRAFAGGAGFPARLELLDRNGVSSRPACDVSVFWAAPPPAYGDLLRVRASIRNVPPPRNPGEIDSSAWLANNEGIRSELRVLHGNDARLLGRGGNPIVRFADSSREWIERTLSLGIAGTPEAALLLGMTVGDTLDISSRLKDAFRATGTYHLFSVSGLHVSIVATLLWLALGTTGIDRRRVVLLLVPCLFFYALVTGLKPPGLRAATMLSILAAGLLVDRPPVALNSLGAAAFVILLFDTNELFDPGFQLSFAVVAAIILFAVPLTGRLSPLLDPDPFLPSRLVSPAERGLRAAGKWGAALFAVSLSAWIGSLPLTLAYFHLFSVIGIAANTLVVPLAFLALAIASLSLVAGAFSAWLAEAFNNAAFLACHVILVLVEGFAGLPGGSRYVALPLSPEIDATITVLDAGRGGACLLQTRGQSWLIDTGSASFANSTIVPLLRQRGIDALDGILLTHGDSHHIGGLERIRESLPVLRVLDTASPNRSPVHRRIRQSLPPSASVAAGFRQAIPPFAEIEILYPPEGADHPSADDEAVVARFSTGGFSALFLSDAGSHAERWLLKNARDRLACDVVIMGRHESGHSGSTPFLAAAQPRAVVAAAAAFPPSQVPREGWLKALRDDGILLFRQDETGAVAISVRRGSFTLTPFLRPQSSATFLE